MASRVFKLPRSTFNTCALHLCVDVGDHGRSASAVSLQDFTKIAWIAKEAQAEWFLDVPVYPS